MALTLSVHSDTHSGTHMSAQRTRETGKKVVASVASPKSLSYFVLI